MTIEVRKRVLEFVARYPGVHVREIERQLGLASKLASYHIDALETEGLVRCVESGGYSRFVATGLAPKLSPADLAFICLMRRAPALRIVILLLHDGALNQRSITARLGLAAPSTSYHLKALVTAGVISAEAAGRERFYSLARPNETKRLLAAFEPVRGDLDNFSRMWTDLFG